MALRLRQVIRTRPCVSRLERRTYASFNSSISVGIEDVEGIIHRPLPGISTIHISTGSTWPKWDDLNIEDRKAVCQEHEQGCKIKLCSIFRSLQTTHAMSQTLLTLHDILNLPVQQTNDDPMNRTPVTVLEALGLKCKCQDLALWTLEDFPAIEISDTLTRKAALVARDFREGGRKPWEDFVATTRSPVFQAYDYTADFHSRDLSHSTDLAGHKSVIDLMPFGEGYARIEGTDIDAFSVHFARDMAKNVQYFEAGNEWRPHLYDEFREKGSVSSVLALQNDRHLPDYASVVVDRPIWELSEAMREQFIESLEVGEDEEIYFEEKKIGKRKKA